MTATRPAKALLGAALLLGFAGSPLHAQTRCRVTEVAVAPAELEVREGQTGRVVAIAYDAAGNICGVGQFAWSSSNVNVARVDARGTVTGAAGGSASIVARVGLGAAAKSGVAFVTVVGQPRRACAEDVQIVGPPDAAIRVGQSAAFVAQVHDRNGRLCDARVAWTSSTPSVATIDGNGIVAGIAPGATTIAARVGSGSLAKSHAVSLSVLPGEGTGAVRQSLTPAGAARPVAGRPTGPGYAAFDYEPNGTGRAFGLVVEPTRLTMVPGESQQLRYRAARADGVNAERVPLVFVVEPGGERIVAVDSLGIVTATGETGGRTAIRAIVPGQDDIRPGVVVVEVRADSVAFERTRVDLGVGGVDTVPLRVPAQNRSLTGTFRFESSDPTRVRVHTSAPVVEGVAPGTARITAIHPRYPDLGFTVRVVPRVAALTLRPSGPLTIPVGAGVRIAAMALTADSAELPDVPLRWAVADSSMVGFDPGAMVVRGRRPGSTILSVRAPAGRDSVVVRTLSVRVVSGSLVAWRDRIGIGVGERVPLPVYILDERRQPLGAAASLAWSSSNDTVAVWREGRVNGLRPGHARLTARAAWDSTATVDVYVVDQMLVVARRRGVWDLYMMNGPDLTMPITQDSAVEDRIAISPDVTRVAYAAAASQSANSRVFVADADGGNARPLTTDTVPSTNPAFVGPEGRRIVYEAGSRGSARLYVVNVDGAGQRVLGTGGIDNTTPGVSPDGQKVVFASTREMSPEQRGTDIYEVNLDGSGERRLTTNARPEDSPRYAPDGHSVFFLRDEGGTPAAKRVYRLNLASLEETPISPPGVFVTSYDVSPDGSALVLTYREGTGSATAMALLQLGTNTLIRVPTGPGEVVTGALFRPTTPVPH